MAIHGPLLIGGIVAGALFLATRKAAAQTGEAAQVTGELGSEASGTVDAQTAQGENFDNLVDVGFTMHDEQLGAICVDANLNTISCLEHDKRILEARLPGGIGAESNG